MTTLTAPTAVIPESALLNLLGEAARIAIIRDAQLRGVPVAAPDGSTGRVTSMARVGGGDVVATVATWKGFPVTWPAETLRTADEIRG